MLRLQRFGVNKSLGIWTPAAYISLVICHHPLFDHCQNTLVYR
jgi:hypothetical protein